MKKVDKKRCKHCVCREVTRCCFCGMRRRPRTAAGKFDAPSLAHEPDRPALVSQGAHGVAMVARR